MIRRCAILLFATLSLAGCREADSYEQFVRAGKSEGGVYVFALDLSDSSAVYDLSFYTKVDAPLMAIEKERAQMPVEISWITPSDSVCMQETVYLEYGSKAPSAQDYRSAVRPFPLGQWTLRLRPLDPPSGIRGIGIICKRNN